ncbi:carboxypeptidase-like regulatory domain-containing protein [Reichenbachiella agarivorans]|uniref:Carboxypeptidase-like regulatory domain-containing protein n=1 Tax=Reichenbachiella agarivorans TaxID=2979464 RepID=A0ABY6CLJ9_9BACT|nr:carboxypeptidase-like regulatory domain-containing protein [Reichenbachiella agarivorans]UXP31401.1 carboxypeptidase-like regulatory domain-containing protein [Reichenbachiella agarivorans]
MLPIKPTHSQAMAATNRIGWLCCLLLSMTLSIVNGQQAPDLRVTIRFEQTLLIDALHQLNELSDIKLSFNPSNIPSDKIINRSYTQVNIDSILKEILGDSFELKYIGEYIIIQKKQSQKSEKQNYQFKGDVKDATTGQTLTNVTIYEVNTLNSTLSDEKGEFELDFSAKKGITALAISRKDYQDTVIMVSDLHTLESAIVLSPAPIPASPNEKTELGKKLENYKLVRLFTSKENRKNTENVKQLEERYFQFSLLPSIGTNMSMGGQVTHKLSFNLLAGYSYGLNEGFELGGLYNINRKNVSGCQIAGFGNTVGGTTHGIQIGGFLNTSKEKVTGVQIAGFTNFVTADIEGLQIAGFTSIAKGLDGTQISGFTNIAKGPTDGFQLSGFTNITKDAKGGQISGFSNITHGDMDGIQISGAHNYSQNLDGMQLTSLLNTAHEVKGFQMSALVNTSKILHGTQLGFINYADSIGDTGLQIGLINLGRKNSLFEWSVEHADVIPIRITFRSGSNKLYTALSAGMQLEDEKLWTYGVGLGSKIFLKSKFYFNPEIHAHRLMQQENNDFETVNQLNKIHLNFGYQFFKHLSLSGGPAINIYISDYINPESGLIGNDIANKPFYDEVQEENIRIQIWLGYAVALRF